MINGVEAVNAFFERVYEKSLEEEEKAKSLRTSVILDVFKIVALFSIISFLEVVAISYGSILLAEVGVLILVVLWISLISKSENKLKMIDDIEGEKNFLRNFDDASIDKRSLAILYSDERFDDEELVETLRSKVKNLRAKLIDLMIEEVELESPDYNLLNDKLYPVVNKLDDAIKAICNKGHKIRTISCGGGHNGSQGIVVHDGEVFSFDEIKLAVDDVDQFYKSLSASV